MCSWWCLRGYCGASLFDVLGLQFISTGLERLILFAYPMLTIFFGWWILDEPASAAQVAGTGLVLVGVWLVSRK